MRQKCIPNSFFERYGGLSFLLKCNCNSNMYRSFIGKCLITLRNCVWTGYQADLILWNNENITIEDKSLFWKKNGSKREFIIFKTFSMKMENFLLKKNLNVDIVYKWTFCTTFKSLRQFQWVLSPKRLLNQGLQNRALKRMLRREKCKG